MSETNAEGHMSAILRILEDKQLHSLSEIASLLNLSAEKVESFLRFLAKYNVITYDEARKTAVISADFLALT
jgi:Mn-dependent DtxR family transcriptional regulator